MHKTKKKCNSSPADGEQKMQYVSEYVRNLHGALTVNMDERIQITTR